MWYWYVETLYLSILLLVNFMTNFIYSQLVFVGAHLGVSIKNLWFLSTWMVWGFTRDISILNLRYSLVFFKLSSSILRATLLFKHPIWFINLDKAQSEYIRSAALICGEFWLSDVWINGLLSNYYYVFCMLRGFVNTPFYMRSKRLKIQLTVVMQNWFLTRFTWPRLLFISNSSHNMDIIIEAGGFGIPCLVVSDIIYVTDRILFPIPGNDQSSIAINFYNQFIANIILRFKFLNVIFWFYNIRRTAKLLTFSQWLYLKFKNIKYKQFSLGFHIDSFVPTSLSLGMVRTGALKGPILKMASVDSYSYILDKKRALLYLVQNAFYFQYLYLIWATNFWLHSALFGFRLQSLAKKRFICKFSKRLSWASFFRYKLIMLNFLESGCFVFLAQSVFLKAFFKYVSIKFFKKLRFLIPSIYFLVRTLFISKKNFLVRNFFFNLESRAFVPFPLLVNARSKPQLQLVKTGVNLYTVRNLWFWSRAKIDFNFFKSIPSCLFWFLSPYVNNVYGLRIFKKLKIVFSSNLQFILNCKWNYVFNNLWWCKYTFRKNRFVKRKRLKKK